MTNHNPPTPMIVITERANYNIGYSKTEDIELSSDTHNENVRKQILENLLLSWNFEYGPVLLEQVLEDLDQNNIHYTGYYNVSTERIDIILEDNTNLVFLEIKNPLHNYWERTYRYELILKGDVFHASAFSERYLNEYDVTSNDYIFPNLSDIDFNTNMLLYFSQTDLSIARNQLFAKHGRKFTVPLSHAVFSQKDWYTPTMNRVEFDKEIDTILYDIEKTNLAMVLDIETNQYYRKSGEYSTLVELSLYENEGDDITASILNKDTSIKILKGDLRNWVQIQVVATGKVYWIKVQDGQCILPNGSKLDSSQCFEGLTFYG